MLVLNNAEDVAERIENSGNSNAVANVLYSRTLDGSH